MISSSRRWTQHARRLRSLDLCFLWLGDHGEAWETLRGRMAAAGLADRVMAPGQIADVRPYLAASDLFVLPSQSEGMPRALMEAMAMGLPAIATNVGGVPDVLRHGRDGVLVPHGDSDAIGRGHCHAGLRFRFAGVPGVRRADAVSRRVSTLTAVADEYLMLFDCLRTSAPSDRKSGLNEYRRVSRYGGLDAEPTESP